MWLYEGGKCASWRTTNGCKKFKFWNFWEHPFYEIWEYAFKLQKQASKELYSTKKDNK